MLEKYFCFLQKHKILTWIGIFKWVRILNNTITNFLSQIVLLISQRYIKMDIFQLQNATVFIMLEMHLNRGILIITYCTSQYHIVLIILNLVYKQWNSFESSNLKAKISTLTRELFFDVLAKQKCS